MMKKAKKLCRTDIEFHHLSDYGDQLFRPKLEFHFYVDYCVDDFRTYIPTQGDTPTSFALG